MMKLLIYLLLSRSQSISIHDVRRYLFIIKWLENKNSVKRNKKVLVIQAQDLFFGCLFSIFASYSEKNFYFYDCSGINAAVGSSLKAKFKRILFGSLKSYLWKNIYSYNLTSTSNQTKKTSKDYKLLAANLHSEFVNAAVKRNFIFQDILIGDLIIDTYTRFKPAIEVNYNDPFIREIICYALKTIDEFTHALESIKPDCVLTGYSVYCHFGLPTRVALARGYKVHGFGNDFAAGARLTKQWPYHTPNTALQYIEFRKSIAANKKFLMLADRKLKRRLSGNLDPGLHYMKNSAYRAVENTDISFDGNCVVFAHLFSDSAHIYPNFIFDTFADWLKSTVEILDANCQKFFLKPHPLENADGIEFINSLANRSRYGNFIPSNTNNNVFLISNIKFGVSVYGTIAHELSFQRVPVISCSDNPHTSFDFNHQAKSVLGYKKLIHRAVHGQLCVSDHQAKDVQIFFAAHNLRPNWKERQKMKQFRELRVKLNNKDLDMMLEVEKIYQEKHFQF